MTGSARRDFLRAGLILTAAGVVMARPWRGFRSSALRFEDIDDLPPLRRLASTGDASIATTRQAAMIGVAAPAERSASDAALRTRLRETICSALGLCWRVDAPVPVTYFTDIRCPLCRRVEADLAALKSAGRTPFQVRTREYPVLGVRSEAAARLIRAAEGQDAAEVMRTHLQGRPPPAGPDEVAALAMILGLDAARMIADLSDPALDASLAEDRAMARLLALPGTPGLVVGRTVVLGAQPRALLEQLLSDEAQLGAPAYCA